MKGFHAMAGSYPPAFSIRGISSPMAAGGVIASPSVAAPRAVANRHGRGMVPMQPPGSFAGSGDGMRFKAKSASLMPVLSQRQGDFSNDAGGQPRYLGGQQSWSPESEEYVDTFK